MRVVHATTGAGGIVLRSWWHGPPLHPYAGDLTGTWLDVAFDDGLRCSCPITSLIPLL